MDSTMDLSILGSVKVRKLGGVMPHWILPSGRRALGTTVCSLCPLFWSLHYCNWHCYSISLSFYSTFKSSGKTFVVSCNFFSYTGRGLVTRNTFSLIFSLVASCITQNGQFCLKGLPDVEWTWFWPKAIQPLQTVQRSAVFCAFWFMALHCLIMHSALSS